MLPLNFTPTIKHKNNEHANVCCPYNTKMKDVNDYFSLKGFLIEPVKWSPS